MDRASWAATVRLGVESEQDENLRRVSHRVCVSPRGVRRVLTWCGVLEPQQNEEDLPPCGVSWSRKRKVSTQWRGWWQRLGIMTCRCIAQVGK